MLKEHARDSKSLQELILRTGASDCCGACIESVETIFENPEVSFRDAILKFL